MARRKTTNARRPPAVATATATGPSDKLIAQAPVPILALDARGRIVEWNRECERLTGRSRDEVTGGGWRTLFPGSRERRVFAAERAARLGQPFRNWHWQVTTARGETRYLSWTARYGRRRRPGDVVWAVGHDVTDLYTARESLAVAAEFLHIGQETAQFGAWSYEPDTGKVDFTPELEAVYGVPLGKFGRRYTDFARRVFAVDLRRLEQVRDRAVASRRPYEQDIRVRDANGDMRWVNVRGRGIYGSDGKLQRIVGVDSNVTERRRTEHALAEKNAYLEAILRSKDVAVFHQDRQLRYTAVLNPALGARLADTIGRTDDEVLGASAAAVKAPKRRVLRTGRGEHLEVQLSRAGHGGWFDLIIEPARDAGGRVVGVVCAAINITERKNAERNLEATNRKLQQLAVHLQDKIEEERTAVARDVHDQVGATLTAMRMRLATLAGRMPPEQLSQRAELLAIAALAESAMHATRDICSQLRPPSLEDIGLAETCRWYLADWSKTARIAAVGRFPRHGCRCNAALETDLFRIFQELLTNVARHSGARQVRVTLTCGKTRSRLLVEDDGHGFASGVPAHGFGLAGVRERARHHGGSVDIRPTPKGTTVDVIIPIRR